MWQTPHVCTETSTSPGPGSGTTTVSMRTGSPLPGAMTPRTSLAIPRTLAPLDAMEHPDARLPVAAGPVAHLEGSETAGEDVVAVAYSPATSPCWLYWGQTS